MDIRMPWPLKSRSVRLLSQEEVGEPREGERHAPVLLRLTSVVGGDAGENDDGSSGKNYESGECFRARTHTLSGPSFSSL